jgi:small multidrug resistance pump
MKLSEGFSKTIPSVMIFVSYGIAFVLLTLCLKHLSVSSVYAIWSALGTALVGLIGVVAFDEPFTPLKGLCLALVVLGVVGLSAGEALDWR